eukprot:SAG22_NODE_1468_length_4349_cov_2.069882_6_plen_42_part_00
MYDGPDGASDNTSGPVFFNTTDHLMQVRALELGYKPSHCDH